MPDHNNICYLLQKAARLFLTTETLSFVDGPHIFQGLSALTVSNPRVVCQCIKAIADTQFEGNWLGTLRIYLYANADDTAEDTFHAYAGELFAKFMTGTAETNLSAALDNFTAQFVLPLEQGWGIQDRTWFSYLDLQVNCCGSDIDIS
jgi:hypothetical protein